jgi:membrane protein
MDVPLLKAHESERSLLRRVWNRAQQDDCVDLAAQMSFYFALSLLPTCLVLAVVVGWLPSTVLWKSFATWAVTYLPLQSRELIFSTVLGLVNHSTGFLSLGLVTALWSASAGFVSMMESLSIVYGERDDRPYLRKRVIAACVTLLAMLFSLGAFGLMAFGRWGFGQAPAALTAWSGAKAAWQIGRWVVTAALMFVGIDFLNFLLPSVRRPWRWVTPGGVFVVLTVAAASEGFNLYFQHFSEYPRIYGALGGFIILMLWIYVANLILLIGAETDCAVEQLAMEAGTE